MPHGIIIIGASGAGTTTLAGEVSRILNFRHFDIDDYYWQESDIPFTVKRSCEERIVKLRKDLSEYTGFVMSGSMCGWSEAFEPLFDLAVWVEAPADIRIDRLERREFERFGDRISEVGDMRQNHLDFIEWAKNYDTGTIPGRCRALHEAWLKTLNCPVIKIDGTLDFKATAESIARRFYTRPNEPWRTIVAGLGELEKYRYTVIFARYSKGGDGWLYARHKNRDTYETAGGHIEKGETALECAKRELYEETGATKFCIHPAFDYSVHTTSQFSYGQVFYADIEELGEIPQNSEMAEAKIFDTIPDSMTYPGILPILYEKMQECLK